MSQKNRVIKTSEITPEDIYKNRRRFLQTGVALAGSTVLGSGLLGVSESKAAMQLGSIAKSSYGADEVMTPYKHITTYNNFYEFGSSKYDPSENAHSLRTDPWSVRVEGECEKTGTYTLEDILKPHALEERIYRMRCVEGWSMVIPWVGFPLSDLIKRFNPTSRAKYIQFETLVDKQQMPGQRRQTLQWPYTEGLRMDEAMHPLTIMAVGLYGKVMPNQNGAPIRLVVPWKYGFKSIKSIVTIRFRETEPVSSWMLAGPDEYGFYSNVNPDVDHPRWSQGRERRLGELRKRKTLMFNGYADEVAHLYSGMDLRKYF